MGHETTYERGNHKLKVKKNQDGTIVQWVKDHNNNPAKEGLISELGLSIGPGGDPQSIVSIPDDTIIRTHSSPGCTWYFFQGKWWRVCS